MATPQVEPTWRKILDMLSVVSIVMTMLLAASLATMALMK